MPYGGQKLVCINIKNIPVYIAPIVNLLPRSMNKIQENRHISDVI